MGCGSSANVVVEKTASEPQPHSPQADPESTKKKAEHTISVFVEDLLYVITDLRQSRDVNVITVKNRQLEMIKIVSFNRGSEQDDYNITLKDLNSGTAVSVSNSYFREAMRDAGKKLASELVQTGNMHLEENSA